MGFADDIRMDTRLDHERAERSPFVVGLLAGELDRRAHVELLRALLPVYQALEQLLLIQGEEASISLFDDRRLDRRGRIADDLRTFGQNPASVDCAQLPASRAYVSVVREAAVSPQRLLAHHYTRYLGDMAGGRVIASRLRSEYDIDQSALTYYDFGGLEDVHSYRRQYRSRLDEVPWTAAEQAEFIGECSLAYRANSQLFGELAAATGMSVDHAATAGSFLSRERRHSAR